MNKNSSRSQIELWEKQSFDISQQRAFWNSWNAKFREKNDKLSGINERQASIITGWIKRFASTDLNILEVGCGTGWFCQRLTPFGRITGTDLSDDVLARSQVTYPEIQFVAGDFMELEFGSSRFDVIVSLEVLSHIADQRSFIKKIASLLRPGGYLALATQNRVALSRWSGVSQQSVGQLRKWVGVKDLRRLLLNDFDIIELKSIEPVGDQGILRFVNSYKINKMLSFFMSQQYLNDLKERLFLGHTLMVLAQKNQLIMS